MSVIGLSNCGTARRARSEAVIALREAKAVLKKCNRVIEDIMTELDTGKVLVNGRSRPLLDAINAAQAPHPPRAANSPRAGVAKRNARGRQTAQDD